MALEWISHMRYLKFNLYILLFLLYFYILFIKFILLHLFFCVRLVYDIALEILPQVGVLIAIRTNALRLFLESESPRSRRWYVSLATSCSDVLRTPIPGHIGRHVRTCETSF